MDKFIMKHQQKINGQISSFDRLVFKGYLSFHYCQAVEWFLNHNNILLKDYRNFVNQHSQAIKQFGMDLASRHGRQYIYLPRKVRKEEYVKAIAKREKITEGLICVLSCLEENSSFAMRYGEGRPVLVSCRPKCLTLYFYFLDPVFGFIHIRLMTWLPYTMQICVNGHEWLAKSLEKAGIGFQKLENAFLTIDDFSKAQAIEKKFIRLDWPRILSRYAKVINPLLKTTLQGMGYYWVIDQAEYSTDIIFKSGAELNPLYRKLEQYAVIGLRAEDIMTYLGRKMRGNFCGEIGNHFSKRWPGSRVKHRMKGNWIKMYDKHGRMLRVETVINRPYEFKVRRMGKRNGEQVMGWYPMAKRVSNMYRYAEVCMSANRQYLDALSVVDDPSFVYKELKNLCEPAKLNNRRKRGLNPLQKDDADLCAAVLHGEHFLHGFSNADFARRLGIKYSDDKKQRRRDSARVSRLLQPDFRIGFIHYMAIFS